MPRPPCQHPSIRHCNLLSPTLLVSKPGMGLAFLVAPNLYCGQRLASTSAVYVESYRPDWHTMNRPLASLTCRSEVCPPSLAESLPSEAAIAAWPLSHEIRRQVPHTCAPPASKGCTAKVQRNERMLQSCHADKGPSVVAHLCGADVRGGDVAHVCLAACQAWVTALQQCLRTPILQLSIFH